MGRDIRIFIFIYIPIFITSIKSIRTPFHTKNPIPHENVLCPVTTRPPHKLLKFRGLDPVSEPVTTTPPDTSILSPSFFPEDRISDADTVYEVGDVEELRFVQERDKILNRQTTAPLCLHTELLRNTSSHQPLVVCARSCTASHPPRNLSPTNRPSLLSRTTSSPLPTRSLARSSL